MPPLDVRSTSNEHQKKEECGTNLLEVRSTSSVTSHATPAQPTETESVSSVSSLETPAPVSEIKNLNAPEMEKYEGKEFTRAAFRAFGSNARPVDSPTPNKKILNRGETIGSDKIETATDKSPRKLGGGRNFGRIATVPSSQPSTQVQWKAGFPLLPGETPRANINWTPRARAPDPSATVRIPVGLANPTTEKKKKPLKKFEKVGQLWEINATLSKQIAELQTELQRVAKHSTASTFLETPRGGTKSVSSHNAHLNSKMEKLMEQLEKLESLKEDKEPESPTVAAPPQDVPEVEVEVIKPEKISEDTLEDTIEKKEERVPDASPHSSPSASSTGYPRSRSPQVVQPLNNSNLLHLSVPSPNFGTPRSNVRARIGTTPAVSTINMSALQAAMGHNNLYDDATPRSVLSMRSNLTGRSQLPAPGNVEGTISLRRDRWWVKRYASIKGAYFSYSKEKGGSIRFQACLPDYAVQYVGPCREGYRLVLRLKDVYKHEALQLMLVTREEAKLWFRALQWGTRLPKPESVRQISTTSLASMR